MLMGPQGKQDRRWQTYALWGLWLAHLVWLLLGRGPSALFQRALARAALPYQRTVERLEAWRQARSERHRTLWAAQAEVERLRREVAELKVNEIRNSQRLDQAEEAGRLLGLKQQLPLDLKAARILANVRRAPFGGMVLDLGSQGGLHADQGVICPEGVVGRLWSVSEHQASVLPLDAYNASTGVMLARSHAMGVLQGTGPGRAEIRYVGAQEAVQVGEPVLTSGLDRVFPRGLLVGYVSTTRPGDVELHIEVALAAPLDRVGLVLILPPKPPQLVELPPVPKGIPPVEGAS